MKLANKITRVRSLVDNDPQATDELITLYLESAEMEILIRMYPFGIPDDAELPMRYDLKQCDLAARYFLRRGADGETEHNENGVNRKYGSVNDEDILREIIQIAKVVVG